MKIIRPEYTPPKKVEEKCIEALNTDLKEYDINAGVPYNEQSIVLSPLEQIMTETMCEELTNPNYVKITITLTKKQAEMFDKKGGVAWLKKALVGQKLKKKQRTLPPFELTVTNVTKQQIDDAINELENKGLK